MCTMCQRSFRICVHLGSDHLDYQLYHLRLSARTGSIWIPRSKIYYWDILPNLINPLCDTLKWRCVSPMCQFILLLELDPYRPIRIWPKIDFHTKRFLTVWKHDLWIKIDMNIILHMVIYTSIKFLFLFFV